jgi:lambda repressor-like predicted transcriptional regulator
MSNKGMKHTGISSVQAGLSNSTLKSALSPDVPPKKSNPKPEKTKKDDGND